MQEENSGQPKLKQETEKLSDENITSVGPKLAEAQLTVPASEPDTINAESEKKTWKFITTHIFIIIRNGKIMYLNLQWFSLQ